MYRLLGKGVRINRATYWTIFGIAFVLGIFLHRASIVFSIATVVASMRRCRDFGWPGWTPWALTGFLTLAIIALIVPNAAFIHDHPHDFAAATPGMVFGIVGLLGLSTLFHVVIGCIPGDPFANRYGPPPLPGVGKGVDEHAGVADVFGDGSAPDPTLYPKAYRAWQAHQRAQQAPPPPPVHRATRRPPLPGVAVEGHPLRAGFGRKGL